MRFCSLWSGFFLFVCACTEPDFLECDGGRLVDVEGELRCELGDDAGPGDAGVPRDGDTADAGHSSLDGAVPGEAPDCLDEASCPRHGPAVLDLSTTGEATYDERIDGADHAIPTASCGTVTSADRDVISVLAPVRSIVEVVVERDADGLLEPVIETFDESARFILTYAGAERRARTMFIQHAPPPESTRVMLHHRAAYQGLCTPPPPSFRGGDAYGYTLTARVCDTCAIEELGDLGAQTTVSATLDEPGDVHVVRFIAPMDATPTVEIAPSGTTCPPSLSGACCPVVVPLRPGSDTARRATYTDTDRSVPTQCSADLRSFPPSNGSGERLLAIYDYDSLGAPGYTVEVTITP